MVSCMSPTVISTPAVQLYVVFSAVLMVDLVVFHESDKAVIHKSVRYHAACIAFTGLLENFIGGHIQLNKLLYYI